MSSKKEPNSFLFAILMCLVTGFLLTAASVGLKDRQDENILFDKQKNILKSLNLLQADTNYLKDDIISIYKNNIVPAFVQSDGTLTLDATEDTQPIYIKGTFSQVDSYAIPYKAYGLWSWVYGYLGFKGDGNTLVGMTVYQHGETPGLGGECEKPWFQNQFKGKRIVDHQGQFVSIGIVKGKASEKVSSVELPNYIDGISGATITSKGLEKYIKLTLENYESFAKVLR